MQQMRNIDDLPDGGSTWASGGGGRVPTPQQCRYFAYHGTAAKAANAIIAALYVLSVD
jgi:hypothetical protein